MAKFTQATLEARWEAVMNWIAAARLASEYQLRIRIIPV